jgi:hypothetical protein
MDEYSKRRRLFKEEQLTSVGARINTETGAIWIDYTRSADQIRSADKMLPDGVVPFAQWFKLRKTLFAELSEEDSYLVQRVRKAINLAIDSGRYSL